ncbi:uncharacterized protein LOC133316302 [Gastrolobium bilobum]|uniref:uncharacterized protein LOC133316302 n=1 Tax=Gastrolobium bilobum TaxID=150636 RepID=UPI002AAFF496|nr:uncharacterized protein LOC133316302 [Gastrolobium bilobum]
MDAGNSEISSGTSPLPNSSSSGDNPAMQITSHRLNGRNYVQWCQSVKLFIQAKGKMGYLDGKKVKPAEREPGYDAWVTENALVMTWLTNSMEPDISQTYLFLDTAHEIWEAVKEYYSDLGNASQAFDLNTKVKELRQGGMTITEYFLALKILWQELDLYDIADLQRLEANARFKNYIEKRRLYDFLRGRILGQNPLPSLVTAFSEVRREELRRKVMLGDQDSKSSDGSALIAKNTVRLSGDSKRSDRWCSHCNKGGHTREKCWEIHRKPPNWKPKGQNKNRANQVSSEDKGEVSHVPSNLDGVFLSKAQYEQFQKLISQPAEATSHVA